MNIIMDRRSSLPKLAWAATVEKRRQTLHVTAGPNVECDETHVVEGAWSGRFGDMGFAHATTFSGTGITVRENHVLFSTPTDTLAPLYVMKTAATVFVSNSLPFVLVRAADGLDPKYPFYDTDIMSIILGLDLYRKHIPTRAGNRVFLYYRTNLAINSECRISQSPKPPLPRFSSFEDYAGVLENESRALMDNAASEARKLKYEPLATLSTGYDSPACAAIAKQCGCTKAITLSHAQKNAVYFDDDGGRIGEHLGLDVTSRPKNSYFPDDDTFFEAEFLASGYGGDDIVWAGAQDFLSGKLLLTGYHGDKIWSLNKNAISSEFKRGDPSGASLLEFRLHTGFINIAVPFIGCRQHEDIWHISQSSALAAWRLGVEYDRPIPRRIAEQAGVPRELFGQEKKAVSLPYQSTGLINPPLEQVLGEQSLADFREFLASQGVNPRGYTGVGDRALRILVLSTKIAGTAKRVRYRKFLLHKWRRRKPVDEHNFLVPWAVAHLRERYEQW